MATILEKIEKSIDELMCKNAEREAALNAKLTDLKAKSGAAAAASEVAFDATNLEAYYDRLAEKRAADDEYRMLEARRDDVRKKPLLPENEYEAFVQEIIKYEAAERTKAEQAAYKHIEAIKQIAEKSLACSDAARGLIHRLQHEVFRDKGRGDSAIHAYLQERDRVISPEALQTLLTYLCDPTYPSTSYIYTTYAPSGEGNQPKGAGGTSEN